MREGERERERSRDGRDVGGVSLSRLVRRDTVMQVEGGGMNEMRFGLVMNG